MGIKRLGSVLLFFIIIPSILYGGEAKMAFFELYVENIRTFTYAPIDKDNIEELATYKFKFFESTFFPKNIIGIISNENYSAKNFDELNVRLKLVDKGEGHIWYVDSQGHVLKDDSVIGQIDDDKIEKLMALVESISGVVDLSYGREK